MIAACDAAGSKLMYAEELCFAPKYERVRRLVQEGAVGDVYMLKQLEKHSGPHSDWFYDVDQSGGGALMDMGCHAFGWFRWMLGGNPGSRASGPRWIPWCTRAARAAKTTRSRSWNSSGGVIGLAEDSWAKPGGMDDRIEVYGTRRLQRGRSVPRQRRSDLQRERIRLRAREGGVHRRAGRSRSSRKCSTRATRTSYGTSSTACVTTRAPLVTGRDGRAVLEMLYAAYASARTGQKVALPFTPSSASRRPVERADRHGRRREAGPRRIAGVVGGARRAPVHRAVAGTARPARLPADRAHAGAHLRQDCRGGRRRPGIVRTGRGVPARRVRRRGRARSGPLRSDAGALPAGAGGPAGGALPSPRPHGGGRRGVPAGTRPPSARAAIWRCSGSAPTATSA